MHNLASYRGRANYGLGHLWCRHCPDHTNPKLEALCHRDRGGGLRCPDCGMRIRQRPHHRPRRSILRPEARSIYFEAWLAARAIERERRGEVTYVV